MHLMNRNEEALCGGFGALTLKLDKVTCTPCISIVELVNEGKNCEVCTKPIKLITPPAKGVCSENCLAIRDES